MRYFQKLLIVLLSIAWFFNGTQTALATPPDPSIPETPPLIPDHLRFPLDAGGGMSTASLPSGELPLSTTSLSALPPLKAVLLVGPIDGDYGSWTEEEKSNMELAARELQTNGVSVHKFYAPYNDWSLIKKAAEGAHFLLYRGHGVFWGDPNFPTAVGGFALKDLIVTPDMIRSELKLARNAIIMVYGCYSAGSSSSDTQRLTTSEAQRRAALYSQPFLDIGAGGYFADWFGNAFQMYIRYLFQGKTLGQAYESFFDFNSATVERYLHPVHSRLAMWLDKDEWYDPKPQYNNAFIGQPSARLEDLFAPAQVEVVPNAIHYLAEPFSGPRTIEVQINSAATDTVWTTSITPGVSWIQAPSSGTASDPIRVTVTPPESVGTYQATISIQAGTSTTQNVQVAVPVTLHITNEVIFLPGLIRGR